MNSLLRGIMVMVVLVVFFLLIKTNKIKITLLMRNIIVIAVLGPGSFLLSFIPFEDWFITFKSPADVYKYETLKTIDDGSCILNGKNSVMISAPDEDKFYLKTTSGWKLNSLSGTEIVFNELIDKRRIIVKHYKNTSDYYVSILNYKDSNMPVEVSDSANTDYCLRGINSRDNRVHYYKYVGYVYNVEEEYYLIIDGKKIKIKDYNL